MLRSCAPYAPVATSAQPTSHAASKLLIAIASMLLFSCARYDHLPERISDDTRALYNVRYAAGDDPAAALPSHDDRAWTRGTTYDLPLPPVVLWLRTNVEMNAEDFNGRTAGIFVSALAVCDVYWDGRHIGTTSEIDNFLPLHQDDARTGTHLLAVRVRANALPAGTSAWFYGIGLGDYRTMVRRRIVAQIIPMIGAGAFLIVAAWYLALWISVRRRASVLVFAVLCGAAALLAFAEGYRGVFNYPVAWHIIRLRAILSLTFAICTLLPLFLALEMGTRRPLLRIAAFIPVLAIAVMNAGSYDKASLLLYSLSLLACVALVSSAIPRRGLAALPAAIGVGTLAMTLIAGGYRFGDRAFFVAFTILIVCLLLSLSVELGRAQRQHHHTRLRAARLEAEMLKKSIHPHFIMNTLTAVMEWIEENPRQGVRFLESLAEELRLFLDIASRKVIPMEKELALCRAHLQIMSCRKAMQFSLETDGVELQEVIPPAIFHTLVENAISHNAYDAERVAFRLREERASNARRFVFSAPLRSTGDATRGGVGMRYVQTRLEETYPGRWSIRSFAEGDLWQTAIEVPA